MEAPDQNKIIGKEIAVAKAFSEKFGENKFAYEFRETLTVDPIVMEMNSVTMESLRDCVKQLEATGSYDELAKEHGYREEGHKMTGLVISSKLDPRVCMSVEFGRRWNKDSDQQAEKTGDKDVTLKWFLNDEPVGQHGMKGSVPERQATPEELDIISKLREQTKLKSESLQPVMNRMKAGARMLVEDAPDMKPLYKAVDKLKKSFKKPSDGAKYVSYSSIFDSKPYYQKEKIADVLKRAGMQDVHFEQLYGWPNQPEVVVFKGDEEKAKKALSAAGDEIHPKVKTWGVLIRDRDSDWESAEAEDAEESKRVTEADEENPSGDREPVEREVVIKMTIKEAAEALGYLSGKHPWKPMNDYMDADPHDDVWHSGYSAKDVQGWNDPKGMDDVTKIFPTQVAIAGEDAGREAVAAEIGKARRDAIIEALEMINPAGEYMSGDGEMISVGGTGVTSASMDVSKNEVVVTIKNPEHLINDIVAGVGMFAPELDPYEAASNEEIKRAFIGVAGDYFDVYGDRKPSGEADDRMLGGLGWDDDYFAEEVKHRISGMSIDEIAEAVEDAVDSGRIESEAEAISLAAKLSEQPKKDIAKAVKERHTGTSQRYAKRAADVPEESRTLKGESMSEGKIWNDWDDVDFFGVPKISEESSYKPTMTPAASPHVDSVAKKDKEVEKRAATLKATSDKKVVMGGAIAKPESEVSVGVKSGETEVKDSSLSVGSAEKGRGDVMQGKGSADDQQKEVPAAAIKTGDAKDGRGKVMGEATKKIAESRRAQVAELMKKNAGKMQEWRKKKMAERAKKKA